MRLVSWLTVVAGLSVSSAFGGTITYSVTSLGGAAYRYIYTFNGFTFQQFQDVDLIFDRTLYSNLSNPQPTGNPGWQTAVFQPDNPNGVDGDYTAEALVNNPSLALVFSVDFQWLGVGTPGSQNWVYSQLNSSGNIVSTLETGTTALEGVPEPSTFLMGGGVLVLVALARKRRRARA